MRKAPEMAMNNLFCFWTGFTPVKYAIAFNRASRISWVFFKTLTSHY
jgi:hypothetical protein